MHDTDKKFYIQWHITNLCNLRCKHCYHDNYTNARELDWAGLKRVSDNIAAALKKWGRSATITVTGGEPFIKKELFLLLGYLNNIKEISELNIITNLTTINNSVMSRLRGIPKLRCIKFSLEGMSPKTNDPIRGPHSFNKIMESLEVLERFKQFERHLMFTVLKSNLKEIPKVFSFVKEHDLDGFILERFIPIGNGASIKNEVLSKDDWKEVTDMMQEFCQINADEDAILAQRAFWVKHLDSTFELMGAPCTVASDGFCIMPDSTVLPCRRFNIPVGILLDNTLEEIWDKSNFLKSLKKKSNLKGKCKTCPIDECRGCRALAHSLTGDYLEEDSQCWYEKQAT